MLTESLSFVPPSPSARPVSGDPPREPRPATLVAPLPGAEDWPTLEVLSARYLRRVLDLTGGNKTQAAEMLGIDRRTVDRMLARERQVLGRSSPAGAPGYALAAASAPGAPPAHPAHAALLALGGAIDRLVSVSQQMRAVEIPPDADPSAWRRALRRLSAGMVEVQASARDLAGILPSAGRAGKP